MVDAKSSNLPLTSSPSTPQPQRKLFFMVYRIIRILAILLSAASIAVMVTNSQSVTIFMFQFEAHYYYSSSLKFFVAANAIVCGFSLLTLIVGFLLLRRPGSSQRIYVFFFLFLHDLVIFFDSSQRNKSEINNSLIYEKKKISDYYNICLQVMTVLMISACAAATAIGYVGQYGESHVGWQAICDRVPKFCRRNLISLFLSYLAFFAYLGLTILTAYKLMSSPPKN